MNKVISTRLDPAMIAKARDGLKARGYETEQINNVSAVVRLTFFYGLAELQADALSKASAESLLWVQQKVNQRIKKKNISLADIIAKQGEEIIK